MLTIIGFAGIFLSIRNLISTPGSVKSYSVFRLLPSNLVKARSNFCTPQYIPVCTINGKTFSNACEADRAGIPLLCKTKCPCKGKVPVSYFRFTDRRDTFVFKLTEQSKIDLARKIIKNKSPNIINGIISKGYVPYNKPWGFYYQPLTIDFPTITMEVCDAGIKYVQDHLKEVGNQFLPGNRWCPWSASLLNELDYPYTFR
jgi:hypothetical protein